MRGLNNALDTMKGASYSIVPIHERSDLFDECCRIINAEWPASKTRRLKTFAESCEVFPTCLVLLNRNKVVGHCKLSLIPSEYESCFLSSVVIDHPWRSQGMGSMLLKGAEEYASKKGIQKVYLSTNGQEGFYLKNGYRVCPPVNIWSVCVPAVNTTLQTSFTKAKSKEYAGPPPPPMPEPMSVYDARLTSSKTYMVKSL